jgi:hypothetical protein
MDAAGTLQRSCPYGIRVNVTSIQRCQVEPSSVRSHLIAVVVVAARVHDNTIGTTLLDTVAATVPSVTKAWVAKRPRLRPAGSATPRPAVSAECGGACAA